MMSEATWSATGCSTVRLAREGWPVRCQGLLIKARQGRRQVEVPIGPGA